MQKKYAFSILLAFGLASSSLDADNDDIVVQGGQAFEAMVKNAVANVASSVKKYKIASLVDPEGDYTAMALQSNPEHKQAISTIASIIKASISDAQAVCSKHKKALQGFTESYQNSVQDILNTTSSEHSAEPKVFNAIVQKFNQMVDFNTSKPTTIEPWYSKAWNAEIAGYKGVGKYVIVGTSVVLTAALTAYYLGYFDKNVTVEQMMDNLIAQAQENPNIVLVELPKILASCKDEHMQLMVLQHVLSNVEITPEIKKAFVL